MPRRRASSPRRWVQTNAYSEGTGAVDPVALPGRYLHHSDGTWSFVGPDGWPVAPDDFAELTESADSGQPVIESAVATVIDVAPVSVTDTVARAELEQ